MMRAEERWRVSIRALLLLVAVLFPAATPQLLVICVSEGDHVRLESQFETIPCEVSLGSPTSTSPENSSESCTDLQAAVNAARIARSSEIIAPEPVITAPTHVALRWSVPVLRYPAPQPTEQIPSVRLASIQATILRI